MDENKTPAQQAPDTAAPETANIEATTQPETAPAPEVTAAPAAPETPAQKAGHGTRWHHALWRGVAGLLAAIRTAGKLEKETEQQLASAIAETVSAFLAAL